MNDHVKALFDQARMLSPREREELADLLLGTLPSSPEVVDAWTREVEKRWASHVESKEERSDALSAVEAARNDLRKRRNA